MSTKRDWLNGILGADTAPSAAMDQYHTSSAPRQPPAAARMSSPARFRRPSLSASSSVRGGGSTTTSHPFHPTDDEEQSLDFSNEQRNRYSYDRDYQSDGGAGCLNVTDRLCDFYPCLGPTTPRQQQQRQGRMELEQQQLQFKIRELRQLNGKLFARNQILEQEHSAALATALQTTATSDGTVTALQQRCQEAERKNVQLQTDLTMLQSKAEAQQVANASLQDQLNGFLPQQQDSYQRDVESPETDSPKDDATIELARLTKALKESEEQLSLLRTEQHRREQEHAGTVQQLQSDLGQAKDAYFKTETELKAQIAKAEKESEATLSSLRTEHDRREQEQAGTIQQLQGNLDHSKQQFLETEITLKAQIETLQATAAAAMETCSKTSANRSVDTELLNERDDTIASLRQQCLDYSQQLTTLQTQIMTSTTNTTNDQQGRTELLDCIQDLEQELGRTKRDAQQQVTLLSESIAELETKYGTMERQLLEAKLELAAADEVKGQLLDEHQASIDALQQEKERLEEALDKVQRDKDSLAASQKSQLESVQATERELRQEFEALSAVQTEKDDMINELTVALESIKASKERLVEDHERQRSEAHQAEEAQIGQLKTDLDTRVGMEAEWHQKSQQHAQLVQELRKAVQLSQEAEEALRRELASAVSKEQTTRSVLDQQTQERDVTIAKLQTELERMAQQARQMASRGVFDSPLDAAPTDDAATQSQRIEDLSSKVKKLKKQLTVCKNENARLRVQVVVKSKGQELKLDRSIDTDDTADDDSSTTTASSRRLLKERDDAISALVKQAMAQDVVVTELRKEIDQLNAEKLNYVNVESSESTVKQLQQEADVFAGQVIELDGEIEQLKSALSIQERKVLELEDQLAKAKSQPVANSSSVHRLEAEIDELREANTTQRNELRELRRKAWEAESASDEMARLRNEAAAAQQAANDKKVVLEKLEQDRLKLQEELDAERTNKATIQAQLSEQLEKLEKSHTERVSSLQTKLDESRWAFDELKASPSHMSEEGVIALRQEIATLRQDLTSQTHEADNAKITIRELEGMLAERNSAEAGAFEEEKEDLLSEIESLTRQLEEARERIKVLETDVVIIEDFKAKLERADEARAESEKNIVDAYERKVSLLTLDKDVTIDKLRKELVIEKESNAEELQEVTNQLKVYQMEISDLREEMTEQVSKRETRIFELEHILAAQEQLVSNMKIEMDHLQGSMEGSAARRKEENDEMQQELLTLTAAAAKQEREIQSLRMELESKTLEHKSEVAKLENKITVLEKNPQELRNAHDLQMELRVKEVKDRLEKLKWRNTSLKEENLNLRERLEQAEALAKESADHDRTKALETQLAKQMAKVKSLESQLKSLKEPPVPDVASGPGSREPPAGAQTKLVPEPPVRAASPTPASIDKKLSAPSPTRGMLKIFGRKNVPQSPAKSVGVQ